MSALIVICAFAAWGAVHSLLASHGAKARARGRLGPRSADGLYRLAYNLIAIATFVPVAALALLLPDRTLYRLPWPALLLSVPLQVAAALALLVSLLQVDFPSLLGLPQFARWLRGRPGLAGAPHLVTGGMYARVRHPIYFYTLLIAWLSPVMTANLLAFNVAGTLYIWIGSIFEERKLAAEFGDEYRAYQRRVPRLLPRLAGKPSDPAAR